MIIHLKTISSFTLKIYDYENKYGTIQMHETKIIKKALNILLKNNGDVGDVHISMICNAIIMEGNDVKSVVNMPDGARLHKILSTVNTICSRYKIEFIWENFIFQLKKDYDHYILYQSIKMLHYEEKNKFDLNDSDIDIISKYLMDNELTPKALIKMQNDKDRMQAIQGLIDNLCHNKLHKVAPNLSHIILTLDCD